MVYSNISVYIVTGSDQGFFFNADDIPDFSNEKRQDFTKTEKSETIFIFILCLA